MRTRLLVVAMCVVGLCGSALRASAAAPVITAMTPNPVSANTGASITITGTDFGSMADTVRFAGSPYSPVTPLIVAPNVVVVRVPYTWSGDVTIRSAVSGLVSAPSPLTVSYNYTGTKWNTTAMPFTWYTNSSGAPGLTYTETHDALAQAYETWECASGMTCTDAGTTSTLGNSQSDGKNVCWWSNLGSGGTIAVTNWVYYVPSGDIREFDITFNSYYAWAVNGDASKMDILNIATHEAGHSIGLGDMYGAADAAKTMYGYSNYGDQARRTLTPDDVTGVEWMYAHTSRPNFIAGTPSGWYGSIVPRATNDANGSYAPLPATLPNSATTYVNCGMINVGGDCAAPFGVNDVWLDDVATWWNTWGWSWGAGYVTGWTNMAHTVRGGRHTLKYTMDDNNDIVEAVEVDNTASAQFVWDPYTLTDQVPLVREGPPAKGGFSAPNCDGYRINGNWWGAIATVPQASGDDYDVTLYGDYANSTTGFTTPLASSTYGGDATDFVGFNGNVIGSGASRQAGVVRYAASSAATMVVHQSNQVGNTLYPSTTYNSTVNTGTVNVAAHDLIKVHEVYLGSTATTYTFTLENQSGTADLDVGLYSSSASYFARSDYLAASTATLGGGNESFSFKPSTAGYYGVVVWKKSRASDGLANSYILRVGPSLSNICVTGTPAGWASPAVPRDSSNATTSHVVLTPVLHGNTADTYLNWSAEQQGPNPIPSWELYLIADEDGGGYLRVEAADYPVQWDLIVNTGPWTMRGGRHSLRLWADQDSLVPESNENDDTWRGQWVWSPLALTTRTAVSRILAPHPGVFVQPNTDGFQVTRSSSYAWVTASAPTGSGDDYDLYVYDDYANSTTGFSNLRGYSAYGSTATDFVVGHYSGTPTTLYPGVTRYAMSAHAPYYIDNADASSRNGGAPSTWLSQTLGVGRLADVYEVSLTIGQTYTLTLKRESGTADLMMEVFPARVGKIYGRGYGLSTSSAIYPDQDRITITAESTGWHPLVVFRNSGTEAGSAVTYSLYLQPGSVVDAGSPPEVPATLAWQLVSTNPARREVRCELRAPRETTARLRVFDAKGRCVRTYAPETFTPGVHAVTWDGRTDAGILAGTGVYVLRLDAGTARFTQRAMLVR